MDLGLKGMAALVTGASKGIGRAIAEGLAAEGADVAICARGQADLDDAVKALLRHGGQAVGLRGDASKTEEVERVVAGTVEAFGGIDILVNNAGDVGPDNLLETSDEEWRACLDLNLSSAVRFTRGVVPHMRKQGGGRIINVSSIGGHTPGPFLVDYAAAKAAILAFTKSSADLLAPDQILVNSVCPGCTQTPLWERLADQMIPAMGQNRDEVYSNMADRYIALKRYGQPEEIAAVVAFLASGRASYITGSRFDVDGGAQKSI